MAITKCGNGHIYDSDIYSSCPYCNNGGNGEINFGGTEAVDSDSLTSGGETEPAYFGSSGTPGGIAGNTVGNIVGNTVPASGPSFGQTVPAEQRFNGGGGTVYRKEEPSQGNSPVFERNSAMPNGNNIGKTVVVNMNMQGIVPVVGWIVCIDGRMRGKSYNLYSKQNTVGRDIHSDVFIEGDDTISNHQANISYDERHNTFTLVPKTETNTMYLNDEAVYESAKLKEFDLIEMGSSKFVFVPFCSERLTWKSLNKG
jgi:hypothetical protein